MIQPHQEIGRHATGVERDAGISERKSGCRSSESDASHPAALSLGRRDIEQLVRVTPHCVIDNYRVVSDRGSSGASIQNSRLAFQGDVLVDRDLGCPAKRAGRNDHGVICHSAVNLSLYVGSRAVGVPRCGVRQRRS